jgi:D-amino-acid oxidase
MNNSKVALLLIGCAVATLQPGAALSEIFPLKHGIYVLSNEPCGQASFGNVGSYDGKGITIGHASCKVKVLNKSGNTYKVSSKCYSERDDGLQDGQGRHSENSLRRHSAHDRRIAGATGRIDSVRRSPRVPSNPRETCVFVTEALALFGGDLKPAYSESNLQDMATFRACKGPATAAISASVRPSSGECRFKLRGRSMSASDTIVLPTPDFAWDPITRPPIAGLRPFRERSYRLEQEDVAGKFVVHNYGHGGAGITLSWGCAQEVVDLVTAHGVGLNESVAVLGSGVMGMTAATLLRALDLNVTIYAKSFPPNTTSNVAGGQWAPSLVNHDNPQQFARILRRAYATHQSKGHDFGVSPRQNYTLVRAGNFESCPKDLIPAPKQFQHLPFAHLTSSGFAYSTLLVEPPIFLAKLHDDLVANQVAMKMREFNDLSEVAGMQENVIVNCTGLGSKLICRDQLMHAVKGQLVLLPPQPTLQYLFSGHHGYIFPRNDSVVVGGSEEMDAVDDKPDLLICKAILANMKAIFEGAFALAMLPESLPDWALRSK